MKYKVLKNNFFKIDKFSIEPIRMEDMFLIMKWRNQQLYHLRQENLLTREAQKKYFNEVVYKLFEKDNPEQILFSYTENGKCIGYGGLVHINWYDKNAEISFVMDTELEKDFFQKHWLNWLYLIEKVAFSELNLNKIYTYAFDLRPHLYLAVENAGFFREATLLNHVKFKEKYIDVVIHSKINTNKNY